MKGKCSTSAAERNDEARRWLRFAQQDLLVADRLAHDTAMPPRHACWLAQQAAEKSIKAVLVYLDIEFPWHHDLDALRNLVPNEWVFTQKHSDLSDLTQWASEARYPTALSEPTEADARKAVGQAHDILGSILEDMRSRGFTSA